MLKKHIPAEVMEDEAGLSSPDCCRDMALGWEKGRAVESLVKVTAPWAHGFDDNTRKLGFLISMTMLVVMQENVLVLRNTHKRV